MEKVTVYEKTTCTTCRSVNKIMTELGIDFEKVNYFIDPFTKQQLKTLLKKMNMRAEELLRKNEVAYKELDLQNSSFTENEILDLLVSNPNLVQRPIVEIGNRAILARPAEKIRELFNKK